MQDEPTSGAADASSSSQPSPFVPPPKPQKREKLSAYSPTEDTFRDTANLVKEDSEIWPTHTGKNTKKHSLCTESIFICSLHTTEINLRLFLTKKSIDENRWNVCIAYRKDTLPSDTLYANSCCMILSFFIIIIVMLYLYIFALMLLKENVMNILYICKLKRFCLIISSGQTLFWNRLLLIPGDSHTKHTRMPMLLSKVLREPSETLPFDMIILKRFSPLERKHHAYASLM